MNIIAVGGVPQMMVVALLTHICIVLEWSSNNDMASKYHVGIRLVGSSLLLHVHPPPHAY